MAVAIVILALLALSAVATAFGIWWTTRPPISPSDSPGMFNLHLHETRWQSIRGPGALGLGLLLNTAASAVGVIQALSAA